MSSCLKNPHSKDTRQSLLTFQAITNSDVSPGTVGELGTWVFNQEAIRRALVEMIIIDELPFRFLEGPGFRKFILVVCPRFKIPSRWTISRDINLIYEEERLELKCFFRGNTQRVSITTNSWTSIQRINYMVVIVHFIDEECKLHKKIISFVPITSHKGESVAKVIETCLLDWGIRNVYSITLDNASSNDTVIDGLKQCDVSVKKVREVVRYVRSSPARLKKFRDLAEWNVIEQKSSLCLDVPTRWNSTYLMLQSAITYEKVFESLEESSLYVTSNTFFSEISDLYCLLNGMVEAGGSVKLMDPRDKLEYMATQMNHMYGEVKGKPYYEKVIAALKELFNDYATSTPASATTASISTPTDFSQSTIARDVLAILISIVASESAFSTSGRVLDPFRSSLTPKIVEALVCTQDWLRLPNIPLSIEKNLEELERFEQEIGTDGGSGTVRSGGSTLATIPLACMFYTFIIVAMMKASTNDLKNMGLSWKKKKNNRN
ncbi:PREDICTED: zinc finger BED domain-containing protein RICESLEEPER 2-like [Ipomoea nil]|uniref:zinc finger BED domain-containing protein RICESLEEPER 2-like n=1 Tax=Ipomoea nil TaxID=35883 RepID=UPI00090187B0|nr:PREDICTED: zinc finger BED domain-containing protein RICESLEEPER 2-like [Ipomoea nil]